MASTSVILPVFDSICSYFGLYTVSHMIWDAIYYFRVLGSTYFRKPILTYSSATHLGYLNYYKCLLFCHAKEHIQVFVSLAGNHSIYCLFLYSYTVKRLKIASYMQALLYADPFDVESQKKIEAAIRQVYYFVLFYLLFTWAILGLIYHSTEDTGIYIYIYALYL